MDKENLLKQQDLLQKEAREIIDQLDLINFLSNYGEVNIVGSLAMGLMTWRDIDIDVISKNVSIDSFIKIVYFILKNNKTKTITIQDNTNGKIRPNNPNGMYLGFKYQDKNLWKCDIWLRYENNHKAKNDIEWVKNNLTTDKKTIILDIKNKISNDKEYRINVFSTDIYEAVINNGVTNLEEFKSYLNNIGKSLEKN